MSTGRVCDGYGIWGGGNAYGSAGRASSSAATYATTSSARPAAGPTIPGARGVIAPSQVPGIICGHESVAFDYFRRNTTTKLPGVFESGFWDTLMLQASAHEPAVLHAVIALGAAHKSEKRLALREYNKAIGHLCRHFENRDRDALRVALITCMVFVCLELLRGEFKTGQTHLRSGLELLREIQRRDGLTSADGAIVLRPQHESVEDYLVEAFTRLNVLSALFGQGSSYLYYVGEKMRSGPTHNISSVFETFRDARQELDGLINGVYSLSTEAHEIIHAQDRIPPSFLNRKECLQTSLARWLQVFNSSCLAMAAKGNPRLALSIPLLRLYHTMTTVMAATSPRGTDEMIYDSYVSDFELLLKQAVDLLNITTVEIERPSLTPGYQTPEIPFTVDMGFIPPLYYAALKCRSQSLRRMAIDQLLLVPDREGVWEGTLVARIARRVMEMEEGDVYEYPHIIPNVNLSDVPATGALDTLPMVPSFARINHVSVVLPDRVGNKARLVCRRYRSEDGNGLWETRTSHFELTFELSPSVRPRMCRVPMLDASYFATSQ